VVGKLIREKVTVKHRTRPKYSSAKAISVVLKRFHQIDACQSTIQRDLDALGYRNASRKQTTAHSKEDFAKRLKFARKYQRLPAGSLVFTDEKTFTCGDYSHRRQWVGPDCPLLPRDGSNTAQDTVYVWGAIGVDFRKLVVVRSVRHRDRVARGQNREAPEKRVFDGEFYKRSCLQGDLVKYCTQTGRILQADNHRVHYCANVKQYLDGKSVKITQDWPARSPDLNPIENLWADMARRVSELVPLTADELEAAIWTVWKGYTDAQINGYVHGFKNKCKTVVRTQGGKHPE